MVMLGYRLVDGVLTIIPEEALLVQSVFEDYLSGMGIVAIVKKYRERGIKLSSSGIAGMLRNEKYKGEALLQITFCEDFLTKRMVKNEGQVPQYYVTKSHPAIVSPELFELVQQEIAKNARLGQGRGNASPFSGKIVCAECGEFYNARTWHSQDIYNRKVWQCGGKYKERGNIKCKTPHLTEEQIKAAFCDAFNEIVDDRERYLSALEPAINLLTDTADLDQEAEILGERVAGIYVQLERLVTDNARQLQSQREYQREYEDLNARYEKVKSRLAEISAERQSRIARREQL